MSNRQRDDNKEGGVNPDELGPAQPREPEEGPPPATPRSGEVPANTPGRPTRSSPKLPSTGVP